MAGRRGSYGEAFRGSPKCMDSDLSTCGQTMGRCLGGGAPAGAKGSAGGVFSSCCFAESNRSSKGFNRFRTPGSQVTRKVPSMDDSPAGGLTLMLPLQTSPGFIRRDSVPSSSKSISPPKLLSGSWTLHLLAGLRDSNASQKKNPALRVVPGSPHDGLNLQCLWAGRFLPANIR